MIATHPIVPVSGIETLVDKPLIYVAGYYSAHPAHGTMNAVHHAERLLEAGWTPLVPHMSLLWDTMVPHTAEFWYEYDLALLARCDAMFVCPDIQTAESTGVVNEIRFATEHDIPVFYEVVPAKERYDY